MVREAAIEEYFTQAVLIPRLPQKRPSGAVDILEMCHDDNKFVDTPKGNVVEGPEGCWAYYSVAQVSGQVPRQYVVVLCRPLPVAPRADVERNDLARVHPLYADMKRPTHPSDREPGLAQGGCRMDSLFEGDVRLRQVVCSGHRRHDAPPREGTNLAWAV